MNVPDPITFVTTDGAERSFRLTNKRMLAIRKRMLEGFKNGDADFLWEACDEKRPFTDGAFAEGSLTEDEFVEIFPLADGDVMQGLIKAITAAWQGEKKSDPRNDKYRPTTAETQ